MVERLVDRLRSIVGARHTADLRPRQLDDWRRLLAECAEAKGGEVSTRTRAAALAQTYLGLDDEGRHAFLRLISLEFGPAPARVAAAHEAYQRAAGTAGQWDAEAELRAALRSARIRILTQFNAIPQGVKFLVDLRADLLRYLEQDPELAPLDRELESRLAAWFDVGFLELQRITWNSPAALLEKLIEYEAVHEIRSWTDLKNRLDSDRRLYAFFHPRMPLEPLIFVEVALTDRLADNVQALLDEHAPVFDARRAALGTDTDTDPVQRHPSGRQVPGRPARRSAALPGRRCRAGAARPRAGIAPRGVVRRRIPRTAALHLVLAGGAAV